MQTAELADVEEVAKTPWKPAVRLAHSCMPLPTCRFLPYMKLARRTEPHQTLEAGSMEVRAAVESLVKKASCLGARSRRVPGKASARQRT